MKNRKFELLARECGDDACRHCGDGCTDWFTLLAEGTGDECSDFKYKHMSEQERAGNFHHYKYSYLGRR
jgi:hypothetical protein